LKTFVVFDSFGTAKKKRSNVGLTSFKNRNFSNLEAYLQYPVINKNVLRNNSSSIQVLIRAANVVPANSKQEEISRRLFY